MYTEAKEERKLHKSFFFLISSLPDGMQLFSPPVFRDTSFLVFFTLVTQKYHSVVRLLAEIISGLRSCPWLFLPHIALLRRISALLDKHLVTVPLNIPNRVTLFTFFL